MDNPKFVKDYVKILKEVGSIEFKNKLRTPVLVGVGMLGQIDDNRKVAGRKTAVISINNMDEVSQTQSLADRVWPVCKSGDGKPGPGITVGRVAGNDVVIPEYSVSQQHCQFFYEPMRVVICDLGALNGTMVAGKRVAPRARVPVKNKDTLVLGRYQFHYLSPAGFIERVEAVSEIL